MRYVSCLATAAIVLVGIVPAVRAQTVCDAAAVRASAVASSPAQVAAGTRPPVPASGRCMTVAVTGPEVGAPVVGTFIRRGCSSAAFVVRWTVVRTETCGADIHFPPDPVLSVVVLERVGTRLVRRARGPLTEDESSLELAPPTDEDADGRQEIVRTRTASPRLGPLALEVRGARVTALAERDASRPSTVAPGAVMTLELEPAGLPDRRGRVTVSAIAAPDADGVVRVTLSGGLSLRVRLPAPLVLPLAVGDAIDLEMARRDTGADVIVRDTNGGVLLQIVPSGAATVPFRAMVTPSSNNVRLTAGNVGALVPTGGWRMLTTPSGRFAIWASIVSHAGDAPLRLTYAVVRMP